MPSEAGLNRPPSLEAASFAPVSRDGLYADPRNCGTVLQ
jgi:hypothetical protein